MAMPPMLKYLLILGAAYMGRTLIHHLARSIASAEVERDLGGVRGWVASARIHVMERLLWMTMDAVEDAIIRMGHLAADIRQAGLGG